MDERKEFVPKIWFEARDRMDRIYPIEKVQEDFKKVKKQLISKHPEHKEFIESLKLRWAMQVHAPI